MNKYAVSIDIGSSGGKMAAAVLCDGKIKIHDEFVFNNRPIEILGNIYINLLGIHTVILEGLKQFATLQGQIETIGIDSSTAMYGYLDRYGRPKYNIHSSRDLRMTHILSLMEKIMSPWERYEMTGVPPFSRAIFAELYCDILEDKNAVNNMHAIMGLPDIQAYFLTGIKQSEASFSSVTGMMSVGARDWNYELLKAYSIPQHLFLPIKPGHDILGPLANTVADFTGCPNAIVVHATQHDTAAAVAAIPGFTQNDVFLSLGSTFILGIQCEAPIIKKEGFNYHFKNVAMACGKTIYMRDITGFWILDECIKVWKNQGIDTNPANLINWGKDSKENHSYFDVDAFVFSSYAVDMPGEIQRYCKTTNQPVPETAGEILRCILESCALRVRHSYEGLCGITGKKSYDKIYAVSGGIRNGLLCQIIADALQKPVTAGNPMASSTGNLLTQFLAAGAIKSLDEMRQIAKNSFPTQTYDPAPRKKQKWDEAFQYMTLHGYLDCANSKK
jgi:sugar (pentulose or hexulose) kinase